LTVHRAKDVAQRNFRWRAGEKIAAGLATYAFYDLLRLQLDQNLHEVIRRNALFLCEFLDRDWFVAANSARQAEYSPGRVVASDGKFHDARLGTPGKVGNKKPFVKGKS
jgi:hypothetical protein